ncbi:galactokinase [Neptunicella sp. SCSIO 80796]|uniref:galactokinase n=1 Tax=Neptunicella plasticusilytica TaxID=3117012 RepID=UPI003A4D3186
MTDKKLLAQQFEQYFDVMADCFVHAPGRVNLIGEHTDYNGGFVLPAAINFGTDIVAKAREDRQVNVVALDYAQQQASFSLDDIQHDHAMGWSNYIRGVLLILQKHFPLSKGADLVVTGNVPQGAGLSSSASFEIAILKCFAELNQLPLDGIQAALLGQQAENEFVGCSCGIMDQLISAMGHKDQAMLLDCRSLQVEFTPIPPQHSLMIINSNVKRGLVDSEYNLRRQQCEQAAKVMQVELLRDADMNMLVQHKSSLSREAYLRARHVISENDRTVAMFEALKHADMPRISELMRQSHLSMQEDFAITVKPIDILVDIIHAELGERGGVRMTGGGFGGCVIALVPDDLVESIQATIEQQYQSQTGIKESVFICTAEQGAFA